MKLKIKLLFITGLIAFLSSTKVMSSDKLDSLMIELQKPHHDTILIALYIEIGNYYENYDLETAKEYYYKAKELSEKNLAGPRVSYERKYKQQKATALQHIGYIFRTMGDPITASEMYFQALEIGESIECDNIIYNMLNTIGIINHLQGNSEVAEEYYNKALEVAERSGNVYGKSRLLNNLGVLYFESGRKTDNIDERELYYKKALENYLNVLQIRIELNDLRGQMICYNNLGNVTSEGTRHLEDEVVVKDKLMESVEYYLKSFNIASELNDLITKSRVSGNLADVYLLMHDFSNITQKERQAYADNIEYYLSESYRYAEEINVLPQKNDVAYIAMNIFLEIGNINKALEYAKIYIETNKELFSEDKTRSLDEMRVKYETEKKENEIALLSKENELKSLNIAKARRVRNSYIIFALSMVVLMALLYKLYQNRKKTGKILEEKNEKLSKLNTTKDKFISILAHDLKNPFSSFLNITSTLKNDFDLIDNKDKKQCLDQLHRSAEQLNKLLKNMLEWAVIKHKSTLPEIDNLKLHEVTEDTIRALEGFVAEKNSVVENKIPGDVVVRANRIHLTAIINNLVTNAIKFSEKEKPISIYASGNGSHINVIVEDKGIGIAPEDIDKLFRIDIDTNTIGGSKEKGTGMGLILCKELIENMNGKIWVESKPGEGSKFVFTLPMAEL